MATETHACAKSCEATAESLEPVEFKRILVAVDNGAPARRAVAAAIALAATNRAQLALLNVVATPLSVTPETEGMQVQLAEELQAAGRALMEDIRLTLPSDVPAECMMREGDPAGEIIAAAREWDADLIVVGTNGRIGLAHLLLGSTAETVVRKAPCPVLTVNHVHHGHKVGVKEKREESNNQASSCECESTGCA
jgi:nucleotide-binding universal stress UspA family protein